jgi:hypothetical protein
MPAMRGQDLDEEVAALLAAGVLADGLVPAIAAELGSSYGYPAG